MSDSKFRLAVCQIRTRREKQDTLVRAEEMIRRVRSEWPGSGAVSGCGRR